LMAEYVMTVKQLENALASAKDRLPAYRVLLDFYEKIFMAQEASKQKTAPVPPFMTPDVVSAKQKDGFPLVNLAEFPIDVPAASELFDNILEITRNTPGRWAEFTEAILNPSNLHPVPLSPPILFEKFLCQDDDFFVRCAKRYGVDSRMLGFVVSNSLQPSLSLSAQQLEVFLKSGPAWEKGYCPICGSLPGLAVLENDGTRALFCTFCFHKWPTKRLYCPYCGNTNSGRLQYFYSEQETGYRVELCEGCGKYLKSVDLREITHPMYPPLELLTTLHLDIKAREAGYESAVSLLME